MSQERSFMKNLTTLSYLILNPFAKIGNEDLDGRVDEDLYYKYFHIIESSTYKRMCEVVNVATDATKNTLFITGFRGSGKTTFSRYLDSIINSKLELPGIDSTMDNEINSSKTRCIKNNIDKKETNHRIKDIINNYENTKEKIRKILSYKNDFNDSTDIASYINKNLKGNINYLNFEVGTNEEDKYPVKKKLCLVLMDEVKNIIENEKNIIFHKIHNFYKKIKKEYWRNFDQTDTDKGNRLIDFDTLLCEHLIDEVMFSEIEDYLFSFISKYSISELLCITLLFEHFKKNVKSKGKKTFFIFDNIDIIFDTRVLEDFILGYNSFLSNFKTILNEYNSDLPEGENKILLYEDYIYIFVMRETTNAKISEHIYGRMFTFASHFDISADLDKAKFIEKKLKFLEEDKLHLNNKMLYKNVTRIDRVFSDGYMRKNIFSLINNDYKRAAMCLSIICENSPLLIDEYIKLMDTNVRYNKHGARSLLLRLIFDHYKKKNYFNFLKIHNSSQDIYEFSSSRMLLTYISNYYPVHIDNYMMENDETITFDTLLIKCGAFYEGDIEDEKLKKMIDVLWMAYDLRVSDSWNHLITFDTIKSLSKTNVVDRIIARRNDIEYEDLPKPTVRITCTGRVFINIICTHFEFFSCMFSKKRNPYKTPLFYSGNTRFINSKKKYIFELILDEVLFSVKKVLQKSNEFNKKVFYDKFNLKKDELIENEEYIYYDGMLYEEKVIHQHLNYIDSYRLHLINGKFAKNVEDINQRITRIMKEYLKLLNKGLETYYSDNSKKLYNELSFCMNYLHNTKYSNNIMEISREEYKKLKKEK